MTNLDNLSTDERTLVLERELAAPIERVYAAWTKPKMIARWFCPNPDLEVRVVADVVVGGDYLITMGPHEVAGTYRELDPPRLVEFTWRWTGPGQQVSVVRVQLSPTAMGTHLRLSHAELDDAADVANHGQSWVGTLERLSRLLAD